MNKTKVKEILTAFGIFQIVSFFYHLILKIFKKISNKISNNGYILLYHRVDNLDNDPHQLAVSIENFEAQIKFLSENYNVISLSKMVDDVKNKRLKDNSVVVTFDDGYVDNYLNALEILEKYNVPATIFVTSGKVGDNTPFEWDTKNVFDVNNRCMNEIELKKMSESKMIKIGSHTVSHPQLYLLEDINKKKELGESKLQLEKIINKQVSFFAYPFGGYTVKNDKLVGLVKNANYEAACENISGRIQNNSDVYRLPRFVVRNWDLKEFKRNFKKFV